MNVPAAVTMSNGSLFDLIEPRRSDFTVEIIADALSKLCRFTGQSKAFYSVAQHSVIVSHIVPPEHALAGLLHDAAEAFIGDIATPLKQLLPDYREIEERVEAEIFRKFGIPFPLHPEVKRADLIALATEKRDLLSPNVGPWECLEGVSPLHKRIYPEEPDLASTKFILRFNQLTRGSL